MVYLLLGLTALASLIVGFYIGAWSMLRRIEQLTTDSSGFGLSSHEMRPMLIILSSPSLSTSTTCESCGESLPIDNELSAQNHARCSSPGV